MTHTRNDTLWFPETLPELFLRRARRAPDGPAYRSRIDGRWCPTRWRDAEAQVRAWALGLSTIGAGPGVAVAIMSSTRPEWALVDMANLCLGAVTVGLYPNMTEDQVRQLLFLSGARIVVVEDQAKRLLVQAAARHFSRRIQVVTMEPPAEVNGAPVLTLQDLGSRGRDVQAQRPEEFERRVSERRVDDIVSYIYTAGTTGAPKGAMLSHRNFHYVIQATNALVPYGGERALVFLPIAHSLQRYANYLNLVVDVDLHYGGSLTRIESDLLEVQPTCFAVVPRILDKLMRRVVARGQGRVGVQRAGFRRAIAAMATAAGQLRAGFEPGVRGRLQARLADRVVGRRIRAHVGGHVKFIGSGGEPIAPSTHAFFEDVGLPVLVGYGTTETCAPACLNTLDNRRIGTVGRPLPGTEVRIDDDGEILIRGPGVFQGYFRDDAATGAAFTQDGWFKTGDIGTMSRDGFLTVLDRKSALITTSEGQSVAPQPLELRLRAHPWIGQAVVIGHGRPYLSALLSLEPEAVPAVAASVGLAPTASADEVCAHPQVHEVFEQHLAATNATQPDGQRIERFSVLPEKLSAASGELTPTLKVKRNIVIERRCEAIEQLYRP